MWVKLSNKSSIYKCCDFLYPVIPQFSRFFFCFVKNIFVSLRISLTTILSYVKWICDTRWQNVKLSVELKLEWSFWITPLCIFRQIFKLSVVSRRVIENPYRHARLSRLWLDQSSRVLVYSHYNDVFIRHTRNVFII